MAKFNMRDLMSGFSPPPASAPGKKPREKASMGSCLNPIGEVIPSKNQYGIRDVEELAESIREVGLLRHTGGSEMSGKRSV